MSQPYPGFDGGQSRVRDTKTEKGLKNIINGMYCQMLSLVLSLVMAVYTFNALSMLISDPQQGLSSIGILLVFSGLSIILLLAVVIFFAIGFFGMYNGRKEFGDAHKKRIERAMMFVVVYIIIGIASAIVAVVITIGSMISNMSWLNQTNSTSGFQFTSSYFDSLRWSIIVGGVFGAISSVFVSLAAINLVREFCDEYHAKLMNAGLVVYSIAPIVGAAISYYALARFESLTMSQLSNYTSLTGFGSAISFIGLLLFLVGFKHAYRRLYDGDIKPIPEPIFQQWIPYYPPPYIIYPPPPQQTTQPLPPTEPTTEEKKEEPRK